MGHSTGTVVNGGAVMRQWWDSDGTVVRQWWKISVTV